MVILTAILRSSRGKKRRVQGLHDVTKRRSEGAHTYNVPPTPFYVLYFLHMTPSVPIAREHVTSRTYHNSAERGVL